MGSATRRAIDGNDGAITARAASVDARPGRGLPEAKKAELEQTGIKVIAFQMPSRKNPKLVFSFTRDDKSRQVSCEVGTRRLWTDEGEETLLSIEQLSKKIEAATHALA